MAKGVSRRTPDRQPCPREVKKELTSNERGTDCSSVRVVTIDEDDQGKKLSLAQALFANTKANIDVLSSQYVHAVCTLKGGAVSEGRGLVSAMQLA